MKTAPIIFALVAFALVVVIFALSTAGILHPFTARAFLGVVVIVWAFLALLPYFEGTKK
jgi:hypothetical protein